MEGKALTARELRRPTTVMLWEKKVMEPRRGVREGENGLLKAKARGPTKNPQISLCSKNRVRE